MKVRTPFRIYSLILLSLQSCLLNHVQAADVFIVAPNSLQGANGNSGSFVPFLIEQAHLTSERYQQVYASSQFSALDGGGGFINYIFLRADERNSHPIDLTIGNIQIDLSTTASVPDNLSSTFASNVGRDDRVVYSGQLTLGPTVPTDYSTIQLTHPFFYNPAHGNLLMDVRNFTGGPFDMNFPAMDAANVFGDSVSIVYATSVTAATGIPDTTGLVTAFIATPVPEPGILVMFSLGFPAILLAIYQKTKTSNRKATNGING